MAGFSQMKEQILALATLISTIVLPASGAGKLTSQSTRPLLSPVPEYLLFSHQEVLAEHSLDLTIRDENPKANQGFVDNILLALHYLKGDVGGPKIDWEKARAPFEASFTLQPGEVFAFHDNVLPEFANSVITMNSEFMTYEGYKSIWGLGGNGVCHLASLMNWVASEARFDSSLASRRSGSSARRAGLEVIAPNGHNFAPIPGMPKKYGTSIRSQSPNQNLYIINNFDYPVTFVFNVDSREVNLEIIK